jgi:hypothetical protein
LVSTNPTEFAGSSTNVEFDPQEVAIRVGLATRIRLSGQLDLAAVEFGKVLLLEPDHFPVRMTRALLSLDTGRFEAAQQDLDALMTNPGLVDYIHNNPTFLHYLHCAADEYSLKGKVDQSRALARGILDLAIKVGLPLGDSHYSLARACAAASRAHPPLIKETAAHLRLAFSENESYESQYETDKVFDALRPGLSAELGRKPGSVSLDGAPFSMPLVQAH